jgi:hypothetical protein
MKEAVEWIAQYQKFWEDKLESLANFLENISPEDSTPKEHDSTENDSERRKP